MPNEPLALNTSLLDRLANLFLTKLLWVLVSVVFGVSLVLAHLTNDGHWVNRGGALIAALAAGAVLMQIAVEIGIERARHAIVSTHRDGSVDVSASPIDRLADRLRANRSKLEMGALDRQRLAIAGRVVFFAMLGELLHGFGDLLACSTLRLCSH